MLSVIVGLLGMLGATGRYFISTIPFNNHTDFPFATLICNFLGCLLLGWFNKRIKISDKVHPYIKTGVGTGLIGSFTTFSTFSVESIQLFQNDKVVMGLIYILVSFFGGWLFVWLGDWIGKSKKNNKVIGDK